MKLFGKQSSNSFLKARWIDASLASEDEVASITVSQYLLASKRGDRPLGSRVEMIYVNFSTDLGNGSNVSAGMAAESSRDGSQHFFCSVTVFFGAPWRDPAIDRPVIALGFSQSSGRSAGWSSHVLYARRHRQLIVACLAC